MRGRKRVSPKSTVAERAAALELYEQEQREKLRRKVIANKPARGADGWSEARSDPLKHNPYYLYFNSHDGDEDTAKRLLGLMPPPDGPEAEADVNNGRRQHRPDETMPTTSSAAAGRRGGQQRHSSSGAGRRQRLQPVDLTELKPASAKLYVKYEKLYDRMRQEDEQFVKFRQGFLRDERRRWLATHGCNDADAAASTALRQEGTSHRAGGDTFAASHHHYHGGGPMVRQPSSGAALVPTTPTSQDGRALPASGIAATRLGSPPLPPTMRLARGSGSSSSR